MTCHFSNKWISFFSGFYFILSLIDHMAYAFRLCGQINGITFISEYPLGSTILPLLLCAKGFNLHKQFLGVQENVWCGWWHHHCKATFGVSLKALIWYLPWWKWTIKYYCWPLKRDIDKSVKRFFKRKDLEDGTIYHTATIYYL